MYSGAQEGGYLTKMTGHQPVLLEEVMALFSQSDVDPSLPSIIVDATFGGGGHSKAILEKLGPKGVLIAIDTDLNALEAKKESFSAYKSTVHLKQANFRDLDVVLKELGIKEVDKFIFDLGYTFRYKNY